MFKLDPCPEFAADVKITRAGESEPGIVRFRFRHRGRKAYLALLRGDGDDRGDVERLLDIVAGWEGVCDASDAPIEFTPDAFSSLIDLFPAAASDILIGYGRALHESRAGN